MVFLRCKYIHTASTNPEAAGKNLSHHVKVIVLKHTSSTTKAWSL